MNKVVEFPERSTIEQEAAGWLARLDGDDPLSPDERLQLREWLGRSPVHREQLRRLAALWTGMNALTELAVPLGSIGWMARVRMSRWFKPPRLAAALAAVVIAAAAGVLSLREDDANNHRPQVDGNGLYATAIGQQQSIALPDGSLVHLNTDSQIKVGYGAEFRDVTLLRGEAYFTVAHDASIPFRVAAGHGRIRAVGTAFSVHVRDAGVDVVVNEGSVALEAIDAVPAAAAGPGTVPGAAAPETTVRELGTLRAGQVATIARLVDDASGRTGTLDHVASIEPPEMSRRLSWTEGVLFFSGEPLEEVVKEIGRYTAVDIEFADPEVGKIRIGGRFPVGETQAMFETLENTFGLRVTYLSDDHVLVSTRD